MPRDGQWIASALMLLMLAACAPDDQRSAEKPQVPARESAAGPVRPSTALGSVTGALSYPSDYLPDDLRICAEEVASGTLSCDSERRGDRYSLALPPGRYRIWAETAEYPGQRALYSRAVPCGLSADCDDHSPIVVRVSSGRTETGVDPADWYAGT